MVDALSAQISPGHGEGDIDLTVIVVTHNGLDKALATLASAQGAVGDISVEWLIADSGSTDGTPEAIRDAWPALRIQRLQNVGFAAANNAVLGLARGRYVLLLNPDVEIRTGVLSELVEALDRRPQVGAASVVQLSPRGAVLPSTGRFPSTTRQFGEALRLAEIPGLSRFQEMEQRSGLDREERSVDWVVGAFLIVRAEVIAEVGALDERFFLYSEEKDWCYRIRQAGWDVRHLPIMEIIHHTGGYDAPGLLSQLTHSKLLFADKHYGPSRRLGIRTGLALRHATRALAFRLPSSRDRRRRADAEREALLVTLGRLRGPLERTDTPIARSTSNSRR